MFMRIDRLQAELPEPKKPNPNAAAALQELLGGKYGEMSTLGNYMFQSFNFRSKAKLRPFYGLVSPASSAEELGHVELVSQWHRHVERMGPTIRKTPEGRRGHHWRSIRRRCRTSDVARPRSCQTAAAPCR